VPIGLSDTTFRVKLASNPEKPLFPVHVAASRAQARQDCETGLLRAFAVLTRSEPAVLSRRQAGLDAMGVVLCHRPLAGDGITVICQLAVLGERELAARYGRIGAHGPARAARTKAPSTLVLWCTRSRQKPPCLRTKPTWRR
jgi:hypothetical protein